MCVGAQDYLQMACSYHGVVTGKVAPKEYLWTADAKDNNGFLNVSVYDSDIKPVFSIKSAEPIIPFSFVNYASARYLCPVAQGLFGNNDTKFEYITGIYDGDSTPTGVVIKQEDGTALVTIAFGEGYSLPHTYIADYDGLVIEVLHFDYKYFLCFHLRYVSSEDAEAQDFIRLYEFDPGHISTSIRKVADIPTKMKVSPTLPAKNETIKVDLSSMSSPCKLTVVDMNGKVCLAQSVQVGQKSVELSTSGLAAGMYIIRVSDGKKNVDTCRVIIR